MKVIMLQNVKGVGQKDTVVEVSDGYALNALIPAGKAAQATPVQLEAFKKRLATQQAQTDASNAKLAADLKSLSGKKIVMKARANNQGHLFKSITSKDIATTIQAQEKITLEPEVIGNMEKGIKQTGEYALQLSAAGAKATMTLLIQSA